MLTLLRRLLDLLAGGLVLGVWLDEPPPAEPLWRSGWHWSYQLLLVPGWFGEAWVLTSASRQLTIPLDPRRPWHEQEPSPN